MKSIQPTVDLVIAGVPCGPDSDPVMVSNEAAEALILIGEAEEADDLDRMKLAELRALAEQETVPLGEEATTKAAIAKAIRAHRAVSAA